ncbi:hypothetical protein [Lapillicoccus sp.]|uniref:hypothetical protein n=1 Tax=Lapillicoccus sp. TaxID=1909287 RepID=UPI003983886E
MSKIMMSELESQIVDLLPEKETLFFNNNWAAVYASNSSLALNAATLFSSATSTAVQTIVVAQG